MVDQKCFKFIINILSVKRKIKASPSLSLFFLALTYFTQCYESVARQRYVCVLIQHNFIEYFAVLKTQSFNSEVNALKNLKMYFIDNVKNIQNRNK